VAKNTSRRARVARSAGVKAVPQSVVESVDAITKDVLDDPLPPSISPRKSDESYRVTVFKDDKLDYPELYLAVYVSGDRFEQAQFAQWLVKAKCRKAGTIEEADLVIFTGGQDVDPQFYGERMHQRTKFSHSRDQADIATYVRCLKAGIPMLGICRGMQFLHVMNGGKLYQDVDQHNSEHPMWDVRNKIKIDRVSSVHHQACIPNMANGMELIATTNRSTKRWLNDKDSNDGSKMDVEALFYRETCCLGFQGHPEYAGFNYYAKWALDRINDYVVCNPDLTWIESTRRMIPELMAQRSEKWKQQQFVSITETLKA
jgi:gamma-glutamyl-gamma-aminobutyrate hydrolase PuuD